MFSSNFIVYRELKNPLLSLFEKAGIQRDVLSGLQNRMLDEIQPPHRNLSVNDISVFILAMELDLTLVTGDDALMRYAESFGVRVHGRVWILDELVSDEILMTK